jgi:hypothetical protein
VIDRPPNAYRPHREPARRDEPYGGLRHDPSSQGGAWRDSKPWSASPLGQPLPGISARLSLTRCKDIPPFPSYSIEPEGGPIRNNPTKCTLPRPFTAGPVPAPGTPQDRFAAALGHPRYNSVPMPLIGKGLSTNQPFPASSYQQPSAFSMQLAAPGVDIPGAIPASQPLASFVPPAVRKSQTGSNGRSDNSGGGRGPTLPERGAPVTTW